MSEIRAAAIDWLMVLGFFGLQAFIAMGGVPV